MRLPRPRCKRSRSGSAEPIVVGFGNHPTIDRRIRLVRFRGGSELGFDDVARCLSQKVTSPIPVLVESERRVVRGYAVEVDASNIIRVVATNDPTSGVIALVSRNGGTLYGEFVE